MKKKDPVEIDLIIKSWFESEPELHEQILNKYAIEVLYKYFSKLPLAIKEVHINDGIMHLYLNSSALKQKLKISKQSLITSINQSIKAELIRDIFFY